MATADLRPAQLDLDVEAGDDITVNFSFGAGTLTGYTAWQAKARPGPGQTPVLVWTVDASGQAAGNIKITLAAADSAQLQSGWRWDLRVTDPNGKLVTLFAGQFLIVQVPVTP